MTQSDNHHIVVMKFGGTSVATREGRESVIARIISERDQGTNPVVVVSAMGRKGDPYATDTLLSLVDSRYCSEHEADMLMCVGEVISAVVLASLLIEKGVAAIALTGMDAGIVTDALDGSASIRHIDTSTLLQTLDEGVVPIVAGFQGGDDKGILHTLGRGGSDTTACALGVALKASRVDIFTDVDGVFTSDPRIIPEAHVLKTITADELFQMAKHGSKILHAPAAELALESGISMRIRNTFNGSEGTSVVSLNTYHPGTVATAVTTVPHIARIRIRLPYAKDDPRAHMEAQTHVFRLMADAAISIDMFTPMNDRLVFTIDEGKAERAMEIIRAAGFEAALRHSLGKATLVGSGMHGVPGVMARVAECLMDAGIDILQIADSHATISLLVDEDNLIDTAQALNRAFGL